MYKRLFGLLLVIALLSGCISNGSPLDVSIEEPVPTPTLAPTPSPIPDIPEDKPWKIALITNSIDQNEEEYHSAEQVVAKYGEEHIIHRVWSGCFVWSESMEVFFDIIAEDPDVKALIINQAISYTNLAVDGLLEKRNDIFIVYCTPAEEASEVSSRADLALTIDEVLMGEAMVKHAKSMGTKVFCHYSFPRHMAMPILFARRDLIKETCEELDIEFVELTAPDPTSDVGVPGAQQYILEDVPKQIAKYGEDTAFFATNCAMQIPLIASVVNGHAIYPSPCDPSPYHGFPYALGIESDQIADWGGPTLMTVKHAIGEGRRIAAENNMTGRLSTWPVPSSMVYTNAAAAYSVMRINGEVPKDGVDVEALERCMNDYIKECVGEDCIGKVSLQPLVEDGVTYDNYFMVSQDYITY